jgi:hypothetical protein
VENGPDKRLDVTVVESGDGVAEDDRGLAGQAGGELQQPAFPGRAGQMWSLKSSRVSQVPWAMMRPAAASST